MSQSRSHGAPYSVAWRIAEAILVLNTTTTTASEMIPTKDGLPLAREERSFRKPVAPELPTYTFRKVQAKGSVGAERDYIKRYTINTILGASKDPAK